MKRLLVSVSNHKQSEVELVWQKERMYLVVVQLKMVKTAVNS